MVLLTTLLASGSTAANQTITDGFLATWFASMFGAIALFSIIWLFIFFLIIVGVILDLWALYSILTSKNDQNWKILWSLIVIFVNIIGAILYFLVGKKERKA